MANNYMTDLSAYLNQTSAANATAKHATGTAKKNGYDLSMEDFLNLMMVELQNQTIDDTADTGEMLNQMVQMQMVTALSNMTDASLMTYASSMVGKEVTIGSVGSDGRITETVITVIGTGVSDGNQVIFGDDGRTYQLSQIMAVGRLPAVDGSTGTDTPNKTEGTPTVTTPNKPVADQPASGTDKTEGSDKTESTEEKVEGSGQTGTENTAEDTTEVPGDRPVENPDNTQEAVEGEKEPVVEPVKEVG